MAAQAPAALEGLGQEDPGAVGQRRIARALRDDGSELLDHRELVAVAVGADSDDLLQQSGAVFRGWADLLAELLGPGGVPADAAGGAAALLVAGGEGGVILSRAQSSIEPFDAVAEQLIGHVRGLSLPGAD